MLKSENHHNIKNTLRNVKNNPAVVQERLKDFDRLRDLFIKRMTIDSETQDARRREFNQAIFDAEEGWACYNDTDLSMVLRCFDNAVKDWQHSRNDIKKGEPENDLES